jgi:hypothetical protein
MKRIVTIGSLAALLITALLVNLSILDVVTAAELRETLWKSLAVVAVSTLAIVLFAMILRMGRASHPAQAGGHKDGGSG